MSLPHASHHWGVELPKFPLPDGSKVHFFPTWESLEELSVKDHFRRRVFFLYVYGVPTLATLVILELLRVWARRKAQQQEGYAALLWAEREERGAGEEPPQGGPSEGHLSFNQLGGGLDAPYTFADIAFAVYHCIYTYSSFLLVAVALWRENICHRRGLDYEFYAPWLAEALAVHLICAARVYCGTPPSADELPSFALKTIMAMAPGLSERADMARDSVTTGIYLAAGTPIGYLCGLTMVAGVVLPNVAIYRKPRALAGLRDSFWPTGEVLLPKADGLTCELCSRADKRWLVHFYCCPCPSTRAVVHRLLAALEQATQQHRQLLASYEDVVQAAAGVVFMFHRVFVEKGVLSPFVLASTAISAVKVVLVRRARPYILCWMATHGMRWRHVTKGDVERATRCGAADWQRRAEAATWVLVKAGVPQNIRNAAARALGHLFAGGEGQGSEGWEEAWREAYSHLVRLLAHAETQDAAIDAIRQLGVRDSESLLQVSEQGRLLRDPRAADFVLEGALRELRKHGRLVAPFTGDVARLLSHPFPNVRREALAVLRGILENAQAHTREIVALLEDEQTEIRVQACEALGDLAQRAGVAQRPTEEAIVLQDLAGALCDRELAVRQGAGRAFGQLRRAGAPVTAAAVARVAGALEDASLDVRIAACHVLGSFGKVAAPSVVQLAGRLRSESRQELAAAAAALEQLMEEGVEVPPAAVEFLAEDLGERSAARLTACWLVGRLGRAATAHVAKLAARKFDDEPAVREAAEEAINLLVSAGVQLPPELKVNQLRTKQGCLGECLDGAN